MAANRQNASPKEPAKARSHQEPGVSANPENPYPAAALYQKRERAGWRRELRWGSVRFPVGSTILAVVLRVGLAIAAVMRRSTLVMVIPFAGGTAMMIVFLRGLGLSGSTLPGMIAVVPLAVIR